MRFTRWTVLLTATAIVVAAGGCGDRRDTAVPAPTAPPVPVPSSALPTVSTLGAPPRRTPGLRGVPSHLRVTAAAPTPSFLLSRGDATTFYVTAAGTPVTGLVWVSQPAEPTGLPGRLVELPPSLVDDGTSLLVTDDAAVDATHLRSWSPSGDADYLIVYGGDLAARRSVLESIVSATYG